jgi:lipid-A-disaccharide synthase
LPVSVIAAQPERVSSAPDVGVREITPASVVTRPALLFTAFEPSGDDHASCVIAELKARHPELVIYAWGGPKMAAAGATIVERTGEDAVMGVPGAAKVLEHVRINQRIAEFIDDKARTETPIAAHIPVDSPAANGPICEIAKKRGLSVIHLVAPQIWAWGRWRIRTLRKRTDMLLCMLHFEEEFFRQRNVPATFIGHFLFEKPLDAQQLDVRAAGFGDGHPRIAMMPGSRPNELERHLPILLDAFVELSRRFPHAVGVMAATNQSVAERLRRMGQETATGWPENLRMVVGDTDAVVRWCDVALVKSGTVTLQVARQGKPMVVFYRKAGPLFYLLMRTVLATKYFSLPNVIAHRRVVPEFIPHYGGAEPIIEIADRLIRDPAVAQAQVDDVAQVLARYKGMPAARNAADAIERMVPRAFSSTLNAAR